MIVSHILVQKGRDVATVSGEASVADAIQILGARKVGALVVSNPGRDILGIISERDVVKLIARAGVAALGEPVSRHMTAKVIACAEEDTIGTVMERMTAGRFRHMPVETDGKLAGIISIGDVVKARLEQMASESQALREYISS